MFRKVLAAGAVAFLLVYLPLGLVAQEREVRAAEQASVGDWFSSLWADIAAWVGSQVVPVEEPPSSVTDGSCAIDPDGCPGGRGQ